MNEIRFVSSTVVLAIAAIGLSACSSASLSDADTRACEAAQQGDALAVYGLQSVIDNEELKRNADRIKFGTSDAMDDAAMVDMLTVCLDLGYAPAAGE